MNPWITSRFYHCKPDTLTIRILGQCLGLIVYDKIKIIVLSSPAPSILRIWLKTGNAIICTDIIHQYLVPDIGIQTCQNAFIGNRHKFTFIYVQTTRKYNLFIVVSLINHRAFCRSWILGIECKGISHTEIFSSQDINDYPCLWVRAVIFHLSDPVSCLFQRLKRCFYAGTCCSIITIHSNIKLCCIRCSLCLKPGYSGQQ